MQSVQKMNNDKSDVDPYAVEGENPMHTNIQNRDSSLPVNHNDVRVDAFAGAMNPN